MHGNIHDNNNFDVLIFDNNNNNNFQKWKRDDIIHVSHNFLHFSNIILMRYCNKNLSRQKLVHAF